MIDEITTCCGCDFGMGIVIAKILSNMRKETGNHQIDKSNEIYIYCQLFLSFRLWR